MRAPEALESLERRFEGREVLERLLAPTGTLADAEDIAEAFAEAHAQGAPAAVVIQALWDDEPRFESADTARQLFSNLFGLWDLVAAGQKPDLAKPPPPPERVKREKAPPPEPFGAEGPTDEFVEAAWRFLDDHPKEREKLNHAFENRQDALLSWLDAAGLSDDAFGLARALLFEVFAMCELGGRAVGTVHVEHLDAASGDALPAPLATRLDEGVFEAEHHDEAPLAETEAKAVRDQVTRGATALWTAARS